MFRTYHQRLMCSTWTQLLWFVFFLWSALHAFMTGSLHPFRKTRANVFCCNVEQLLNENARQGALTSVFKKVRSFKIYYRLCRVRADRHARVLCAQWMCLECRSPLGTINDKLRTSEVLELTSPPSEKIFHCTPKKVIVSFINISFVNPWLDFWESQIKRGV